MAAIPEPFDTIAEPLPTFMDSSTPSPKFTAVLFQVPTSTVSVVEYFLMEAYDSVALVWKTWVAVGAADPTASQYPGPPFPFTIVGVLRKWSA